MMRAFPLSFALRRVHVVAPLWVWAGRSGSAWTAEGMDLPVLEKQLKTLLPDHGITVQKDNMQ